MYDIMFPFEKDSPRNLTILYKYAQKQTNIY